MIASKPQRASGFTIVELLIVIVVIAILAAITVVAFNGVQQRGRDTIRKSDLANLEKVLELHYTDKGSFTQPENMCTDTSYGSMGTCGTHASDVAGTWSLNSDLRDLVAEGRLRSLPLDPVNDTTYHYSYEVHSIAANGFDGYNLCATLEMGGNHCIIKRK